MGTDDSCLTVNNVAFGEKKLNFILFQKSQ